MQEIKKRFSSNLCHKKLNTELSTLNVRENNRENNRSLRLLELWHLIYPRLLTGFGMLVFFTNLGLMKFQVRYSALFLFFSVIDDFEWFWMESLHKNIQLMWEFLKAPFLVLHFSYYTLMTFLMILSVMLLSMLMILLSVLGVIGLLICGNNLNWLLNLNLIYKIRWTGVRSGLLFQCWENSAGFV